jgi:hypothetical protein
VTELIIYGAYGATGTRIVELAVAAGLEPVVAGRRAQALERVAAQHGLEVRVGALSPTELDIVCRGGRVIVSCVAPYSTHSAPVLEAAMRAGAHYLDCTGEPRWVDRMLREYDAAACDAGSTIVPAAGMGTCANLAARVAAERLTDVDRIDIGYRITGMRPSRGTASSTVEIMAGGSPIVHGGQVAFVSPGRHLARFHNGVGTTFPLTDPLTLSRIWPRARLESFLQGPAAPALGAALAAAGLLARTPLPRLIIDHLSSTRGRLEAEKVTGRFRITINARAGRESRVAVADIDDVYDATGRAAFEIAQQLLAGDHKPGLRAAGQVIDDPHTAAQRIGVHLSTVAAST